MDVNELKNNSNWRLVFESIKYYDGQDESIHRMASLLCRFYNYYDLEKDVIDQSLNLNSESEYMLERKKWHNTPLFENLHPRTLELVPSDRDLSPKKNTLDKLCFVLAADDKYFELLVECIESLKATSLYCSVDIKVLDVGLSSPDYFNDRWGIEVIAPGWPVSVQKVNFFKRYFAPPYEVQVRDYIDEGDYYSVPCSEIQFAQAVLNKPFLHELIPDYDYYFWIDADCWVQDERGLDKLILLAKKQGYAFPSGFVPMHSNPDLGTSRVPESWHSSFGNKPNNASAIYCNSKSFQEQWAKKYREAGHQCGYWWGQEEEVASYCMDNNPEIIEFPEVLYLYRHLGLPVVKAGETVLRNPETLDVIPVIGLGLDKYKYFYPVAEYHNGVLPQEDLISSVKAVGLDIDWSKETPDIFTQQTLVSLRYRCIPDSDYKKLAELINQQPDFTSEQRIDIQRCKNRRIEREQKISALRTDQEDSNKPNQTDEYNTNGNTASRLNSHEFIALREAQVIVKLKVRYIEKLESALKEAQKIVKIQESRLDQINIELRKVQGLVSERDVLIEKLDPALRETQSLAKERQFLIERLNIGLLEAQQIVKQRESQVERLDLALNDAQCIVNELVSRNENLDRGLIEAQTIVKERELFIQRLEAALREAQELAWEREIEICNLQELLEED